MEIADAVKAISDMSAAAQAKGESADTLQCLQNRLTSIKALQAVSTKAESAMNDALRAGDPASLQRASFESRKISVAQSKARQLQAEAQQCASGQQVGEGKTEVFWETALVGEDGFSSQSTVNTTSPTDTSIFR